MGVGIFIGFVAVMVIGFLIAAFAWWAGSTTGSVEWKKLGCGTNIYNRSPEMEEKCSAATGGMLVGTFSGLLAIILIIIGFVGTIIFGVKVAVDRFKSKKEKAKIE